VSSGLKGFVKANIALILVFVLIAGFVYVSFVFAGEFTVQFVTSNGTASNGTTVESGSSNATLTFNITNQNMSLNITLVNITLPAGFVFINLSNSTTASDTTFSNTSMPAGNVTWSNLTNNGFILNTTQRNFTINVSVPTGTGVFNFTVFVRHQDNVSNVTNVSITVQDSTKPSAIDFGQGSPTNNSFINYNNVSINVTFTEINFDRCIFEWNNGTAVNFTNTSAASGQCYFNFTGQPNLAINVSVYINDTGGNYNRTARLNFTVDTARPSSTDFASPTPTAGSTNEDKTPTINITFTETNPERCIFQWFNTSGSPSGINFTNSTPLAGSCSFTLNSQSNGNVNVTVFVNDSAGNLNSTANRNWTINDSAAPNNINIVSPTPTNNTNQSVNFVFVNVTLNETNPDRCIFEWNNGTAVNFTNTSADSNCFFNFTNQPEGNINYTIYVNDTNGNVGRNTSRFFVTLRPDLVVTDITFNSTDNNHPFSGSNITFNATILNNGSFTISGSINITIFWNDTFVDIKFNASSLTAGSSQNVTFATINSSRNLVVNGRHTIKVFVDSLSNVTESNESNNFTEDIFIGYNVSALNVSTNQSLVPGSDITLNVTVLFANGDVVTNLTQSNFTLWDNYTTISNLTNITASIKAFDNQSNLSGRYVFNVTIPSNNASGTGKGQHGNHDLIVQVNNGTYRGNGTTMYNISAPNLTLSFSGLASSVDLAGESSATDSFTININNTGNTDVNSITITITISGAGISLSVTSCTIHNLSVGTTNSSCTSVATYTATDTKTITATAGGFSSSKTYNDSISSSISVTNSVSTGGSAGGGGTGQGTTTTCSTNSDCVANYYCSAGNCTLLSCVAGETISNHQCVRLVPKPEITASHSKFEIILGGSNTTEVVVKNSGTASGDIKLAVDITSIEVTIEPESCSVEIDQECTFDVTFNVPVTARVDVYTGTFRAFAADDITSAGTALFTLTVIPTAEKEQEIVKEYENLSGIFEALVGELNSIQVFGGVPEENLTAVKQLINQTRQTVDSIKVLLDAGDYVAANQKLQDLRLSLDRIKQELELVKSSGRPVFSSVWFWVMILVIVGGVAGFLIYLFMPMKGSQKLKSPKLPIGKGYKPEKYGFVVKLKKILKRKPKIKSEKPKAVPLPPAADKSAQQAVVKQDVKQEAVKPQEPATTSQPAPPDPPQKPPGKYGYQQGLAKRYSFKLKKKKNTK